MLVRDDILVKKRTGGRRRVKVVDASDTHVTIAPLSKAKSNDVRTQRLPLCEDGLPDGWAKAEATHG
jgi:hypothetical protein